MSEHVRGASVGRRGLTDVIDRMRGSLPHYEGCSSRPGRGGGCDCRADADADADLARVREIMLQMESVLDTMEAATETMKQLPATLGETLARSLAAHPSPLQSYASTNLGGEESPRLGHPAFCWNPVLHSSHKHKYMGATGQIHKVRCDGSGARARAALAKTLAALAE